MDRCPDLKQYLIQGKELLSLAEMWCLFGPLLDGLSYAHDAGVVHRDLKPGNILLARKGDEMQPKISDFGIAKFLNDVEDKTSTGSILGTFKYTSPEQIQDSKHIDHRADIYSVGIIMYQVATGSVPFRGAVQHVLYKHLHDAPTNPCKLNNHLPPEFGDVVMRCLAKDPKDRYPDCRTLKDALGEVLPKWGKLLAVEERLRIREERKKARERGETESPSQISLSTTQTNSIAYSREDLLGNDAPSMSTGGISTQRARNTVHEEPHLNSSHIDGRLKAAQLAIGNENPDNSISLNLTVSRNFLRNTILGVATALVLVIGSFAYLFMRPQTSNPSNPSNPSTRLPTAGRSAQHPIEPQGSHKNPAASACKEGEVRTCYAGPAGTLGKGPCKAGTQTCQNGRLGPCIGQVLPQDEKCNEIDDNCDGKIDETFEQKGQRCNVKQYACRYVGTWACNDAGRLVCTQKRLSPSAGTRSIQLRVSPKIAVSLSYRGKTHTLRGRYCFEAQRSGSVAFKAAGYQICTFSARKLKSNTTITLKKKSFLEDSPDYCTH